MDIKILGSGCRKCITLEGHARKGAADLGLAPSIETIHDPVAIAGYGVMRTPALVIDDRVVVAGRVPAAEEVRDLLRAAAAP
ncbi:MAG: thioredoxin family protein [Aphanothece saxicola GSE-SYN-MK-01-06B]|jgi:small redox-active disulfide protein 2|nr:thioredoxin family protein [Aphanothece saxicola GSE-SYN-MK-01-06B]